MQNAYVAKGFLYHTGSRKILLRRPDTGESTHFELFSQSGEHGTPPQTVFHQCLECSLGVKFHTDAIREVYDYERDGGHFVFYAEFTATLPPELPDTGTDAWIPIDKLNKFRMSDQTRHDIVIGSRVIRAHSAPSSEASLSPRT